MHSGPEAGWAFPLHNTALVFSTGDLPNSQAVGASGQQPRVALRALAAVVGHLRRLVWHFFELGFVAHSDFSGFARLRTHKRSVARFHAAASAFQSPDIAVTTPVNVAANASKVSHLNAEQGAAANDAWAASCLGWGLSGVIAALFR